MRKTKNIFYFKFCERCGEKYFPQYRFGKYCKECKEIINSLRMNKSARTIQNKIERRLNHEN